MDLAVCSAPAPRCNRRCKSRYPHLAPIALWGLEAAASQAAVRCGATAADDLQLFFGAVRSVQQLLNELLQSHFGIGFTRRRLLKELVDLGDFSEGREGNGNIKGTVFKLCLLGNKSHWGANYRYAEPHLWCCVLNEWSLCDYVTAGHFLTNLSHIHTNCCPALFAWRLRTPRVGDRDKYTIPTLREGEIEEE